MRQKITHFLTPVAAASWYLSTSPPLRRTHTCDLDALLSHATNSVGGKEGKGGVCLQVGATGDARQGDLWLLLRWVDDVTSRHGPCCLGLHRVTTACRTHVATGGAGDVVSCSLCRCCLVGCQGSMQETSTKRHVTLMCAGDIGWLWSSQSMQPPYCIKGDAVAGQVVDKVANSIGVVNGCLHQSPTSRTAPDVAEVHIKAQSVCRVLEGKWKAA